MMATTAMMTTAADDSTNGVFTFVECCTKICAAITMYCGVSIAVDVDRQQSKMK